MPLVSKIFTWSANRVLSALRNKRVSSNFSWSQYHRQYAVIKRSFSSERAHMRDKLLPPVLVMGFLWPFGKKEDEEAGVDPVVTALKRGILAAQKNNFDEAQQFFHKALELGADQHKKQLLDDQQYKLMQVNAFSLMANSALKSGDQKNAEKLLKDIIRLCFALGKKEDDDAILEVSIKLASMYAQQSRDEEAETGFKFCLEATRKKVSEVGGVLESDTNTLALLGLSCHSYARFMMKKKQHKDAIQLFKESLDVAYEVYGADHPQALVVLNDLASAYVINRQYKEGIECYKEAASRAERTPEMADSLVAFYYNLGEACILQSNFEEAKEYCTKCLKHAQKTEDPNLISAARQCLKDVQEVKKKESQSKQT